MSQVPCNGCRTCCRDQVVLLSVEDDVNAAFHQFTVVENKEGTEYVHVLDNKDNGECVHLGEHGCTIYDHRPVVCRLFDCRFQYHLMKPEVRAKWTNQQIWAEAEKRFATFEKDDVEGAREYHRLASTMMADAFRKKPAAAREKGALADALLPDPASAEISRRGDAGA